MKKSGLILHETFSSPTEEQRREQFQKKFERYLADSIAGIWTKRLMAETKSL